MFGLGMQELVVILFIVIFFYGGKRIGKIGGDLGKSITEFKKAVRDYPAPCKAAQDTVDGASKQAHGSSAAAPSMEPPALSGRKDD